MTENSEHRVGEAIQTFAGVPGYPGGSETTPKYMQEYPTEGNVDSSTYDQQNAIWDSIESTLGYKSASFAGKDSGLQFRAVIKGNPGPVGAPANPQSTNIYLRVKRLGVTYNPWYEIYHTGNLDPSTFAYKTSVNLKADTAYVDSRLASKIDNEYLNQCKNDIDQKIIGKADYSYTDQNVAQKIYQSFINDGLKSKLEITEANRCIRDIDNRVSKLSSKLNELYGKAALL